MTRNTALDFLRSHQPMPSQADVTGELVRTFDEVRQFFVDNPDPACIPLFLGSFADDMGCGVYQLCDDVFKAYHQQDLTPHLAAAMVSQHKGVRWWAAHWAVQFPAPELFEPLRCLVDRPGEPDAHCFALCAICSIYDDYRDPEAARFLAERAAVEPDQELREEIVRCLGANAAV